MDPLRRRAQDLTDGRDSGLGSHLRPVSLGTYPLELLRDSGRGLRFYAPCAQAQQTEIFRGLPSSSGKPCRRHSRKAYRPDCRIRSPGRDCHHFFSGHPSAVLCRQPCVRSDPEPFSHHTDPGGHLRHLHGHRLFRHERRGKAGSLLLLSVLCSSGLCAHRGRADALYHRDRSHRSGKPDSEFYHSVYLDRFSEDFLLSAELDDFLLGLLDGVVRGHSFLYRLHQQRPDHPSDYPGRILLRIVGNFYFFYHTGKLRAEPADDRKAGSHGTVCRNGRPVSGHHGRHEKPAPVSGRPDPAGSDHGSLLRHFL